ncbi:Type I restriction-modification system, specificity subunit S [Methanosarcina mazei C16]|uniref:Type I restriction-modification system, specificity subunit S n=1 Tax=Methanosarcina mazei C16 TaxID=1434113 RepID=A0A0E3RTC2_METMZ|nr:Type I restriction-modification system, specificity subunit S [Methanosarcina mazei C16]
MNSNLKADIHTGKYQTAGGHPTLKDGVCFGPPARLLGDR